MRQAIALAFSLSVAAFLADAAQADMRDFSLVNSTGDTIERVFVESAKSDEWGEDVLENEPLEDGDSVDITFEGYGKECIFDLKADYQGAESVVWYDLNLCSISRLTLFWDPQAAKTWAVSQ